MLIIGNFCANKSNNFCDFMIYLRLENMKASQLHVNKNSKKKRAHYTSEF